MGVIRRTSGRIPLHGLKETTMHTPVTQDKFDELVNSTTKYLQLLMDKTTDLEKRLESLESKKKAVKSE
jgi:hypothetical protein